MATNRVYNRYSPGIPISPESLDATEVMEKIHLPSYLPLQLVVTMLELRQILSHPFMFPDEVEAITKSFGFEGKMFTVLSVVSCSVRRSSHSNSILSFTMCFLVQGVMKMLPTSALLSSVSWAPRE
jgi:hypothetical protein